MGASKKVNKKVPTSPQSEELVQQVAISKMEKTKRVRKVAADVPEDLRSGRSAGRPSNAERTSSKYLDDQLALLAADLLADLRKNHKKVPIERKGDLLCKILPHLARSENPEDSKTLSMEIMGKKYLGLEIKIREAEEATREAATTKK